MQSHALSVPSPLHTGRWATRQANSSHGNVWTLLFRDLLFLWDAISVAVAGGACALAYEHFVGASHDIAFQGLRLQILMIGGMLAAVVLRMRLPVWQIGGDPHPVLGSLANVLASMMVTMFLLLGIGFMTRTLNPVPRLWLLSWFAASVVIVVCSRITTARMMRAAVRKGLFVEHVAIIGSGAHVHAIQRHLDSVARHGAIKLAGVFACGDHHSPWNDAALEPLFRMAQAGRIDRVILAMPDSELHCTGEIVERLKALDVETAIFPSLYLQKGMSAGISTLAGAPLIVLNQRPLEKGELLVKSACDRIVAGVLLALLSPALVLIAIAVKLDSAGPVLFRQPRHGRNNTIFQVLKFRSMTHDPRADHAKLDQTSRNDPRVTRVGRILRATSLDELPQLLNVFLGSMSLVGPRPHSMVMRTEELLGNEIIAQYPQRHRIRPGITGWAQINGFRGATSTAEQVRRRVEHDIYYIENWSFLFDLKILLMTPLSLFLKRDNAY